MNIKIENKILLSIKDTIKNTEYENRVMVVGGYVRDLIMGNQSNDIDLLIDGDINAGIDFAIWFCDKMKLHPPLCYGLYGTAMFNFMGEKIECVAPRSEKYKDDSRNPIVESCTIEEECLRRDFTINSMFINISTDELYDFSGKGLNDLNSKIIRSTSNPNVIFNQDALRMLRCIRFASRYGWEIEKKTMQGIIDNVERIQIITQERVTDEINKILLTKKPSVGLRMLEKTGLLQYVLPDFVEMVNLEQNEYHFGTAWEHTLMVVDNTKPILENRVAALFHDLGKIKTKTVDENGKIHFYNHENVSAFLSEVRMKTMKYPNDIIKRVRKAVNAHMRTKSFGDDCAKLKDKSVRKLQLALGDTFELTMDLIDADNRAHKSDHCMPNQVRLIKERSNKLVEQGLDAFKLRLPVNGEDIISYKNIEPGPKVKLYLDYLTKLWLNNPLITKEECFKHINNINY